MEKLNSKKIQIVHKKGWSVSEPAVTSKRFAFFGWFSPGDGVAKKTGATALKESSPGAFRLRVPHANMASVKSWVGLEEKIVHDYKEQKTAEPKQPVPPATPAKRSSSAPRVNLDAVKHWVGLEEKIVHEHKERKAEPLIRTTLPPAVPAKSSQPAFETFSTQTTVSLSTRAPKLKEPLLKRSKKFPGSESSFWVIGGLAVGVLVFLYVQSAVTNREASQRLAELQNEKVRLEQSYVQLKSVSEEQNTRMEQLSSRVQEMSAELKAAQDQNAAYDRSAEKKYREELMRITIQYETQMNALRSSILTKEAVVDALKAQIQALEKILDQARMAAVSGVASRFFQGSFLNTDAVVLQGKVTAINARQGFIVIDLGADQGARSGRGVAISREGIGLAVGRIDRVYPTMASVVVRGKGMLPVIQQGDTVSFF